MRASEGPILEQLRLVRLSPFGDETLGGRRERAGYDRKGLDIDGCLVLAVAGVEVWAPKVVNLVVVHLDGDPVEKTDSRHWWPSAQIEQQNLRDA
jgi:hypothetical protein